MQYRNLGGTGLRVSVLGLGTMQLGWRLDKQASFALLDSFMEAGGNFLDTANIYSSWVSELGPGSSESLLGEWLDLRGNRQDVVLATKVRGPMREGPLGEGLSRRHITEAVEASLRRLRTDCIDLYQAHWFDAATPIEETMETFDSLVRSGKVRYVGCSNYPAWRLMQALWASDTGGWVRYCSLQPHYNLLHRAEFEQELAEACLAMDVGVVPYSPMAGGFLTGAYSREVAPDSPRAAGTLAKYDHDRAWGVLDVVKRIAADRSVWPGAVALRWLMDQKAVTAPIIGANTIEQLQSNLQAAELRLDSAERNLMTEASEWQVED